MAAHIAECPVRTAMVQEACALPELSRCSSQEPPWSGALKTPVAAAEHSLSTRARLRQEAKAANCERQRWE